MGDSAPILWIEDKADEAIRPQEEVMEQLSQQEIKELNRLSSKVIGAAISVHRELGPGLLESVYLSCMLAELRQLGLEVKSEVPLPVFYRGNKISDDGYRMDLLVEDTLVVELKSVEAVQPVHQKQLLTYLRLAKRPLGLLINFNEALLKDGITRVANAPLEHDGPPDDS